MKRGHRDSIGLPILIASIVGLAAFAWPFLLPALSKTNEVTAHQQDAPWVFLVITGLALLAIALELETGAANHGRPGAGKTVALLGALVAVDAALRLVPTFLGASPIFFLIILAGMVYGPAFGFEMGLLTMLISALLTGGVGPWLPFQMLGAGWVGMVAGWIPAKVESRRGLLTVALFAAIAGFAYGMLLNLWSWPLTAPGLQEDVGLYWNPSLSAGESISRYGRFYLVTSAWYDAFRAVANVILVVLIGRPVWQTLERYRTRLTWQPWESY